MLVVIVIDGKLNVRQVKPKTIQFVFVLLLMLTIGWNHTLSFLDDDLVGSGPLFSYYMSSDSLIYHQTLKSWFRSSLI